MFGLGAGDEEGDGADWAGLGGAGVGVTVLRSVVVMRAGLAIKAGYARSGIGTPSSRP